MRHHAASRQSAGKDQAGHTEMTIRTMPMFFPAGRHHLYGVMFVPDPAAASTIGFVLCPPFADEAVHSHRTLVAAGRRLAAEGMPALLFDYTGTGDSGGGFEEGSLVEYRADIRAAVDCLASRAPVTRWGLLGLRLGANLAVQAAAASVAPTALLLWAPVRDVAGHFREFLRLRLFTEMTTAGRATSAVQQLEEELRSGMTVDVLGYAVSPAMARSFGDDRVAGTLPGGTAALVVDVARERRGPGAALGPSTGDGAHARVVHRRVAAEPFWERARVVPHEAFCDATVEWIRATVRP